MVEVVFQTFSPILNHMIEIEKYLYKYVNFYCFVILPINLWKIWKNFSSLSYEILAFYEAYFSAIFYAVFQ